MPVGRRRAVLANAALACALLIACRGQRPRREPSTSAATSQAPACTPATPPLPSVTVAPRVRTACAAVAAFWRRFDSTSVRQVDSIVSPYASDTTVSACLVLVNQKHSPLRSTTAPVDTAAQRLETALALVRGAGPGWIPLYHFGADGPDGSDLAYQRGRVRCLVEQSWDGGDPTDTMYVAGDWLRETTSCWLMPHGLTAADTARGAP